MTLRQLEYLLAVHEEGSFTRAAERLLVSQPALSHQVRALERSVGAELLERLPGSVVLTPAGRAFLPHAAAALHSAEEARRAAWAVENVEAGEVRLATLYSIALGVVPAAIQAWRAEHPDVHVEMVEYANIDALVEGMTNGVADVAVGTIPAGWEGPSRSLGWEELVVALPADDPLAHKRRRIKLEQLADRPWVLYASENGLASVVQQACAAAGFAPRAAVRTHHTATAVQLAAAGLGPALVPANMVGPDFGGVLLRPDPAVRRELVAFTRPDPSPLITAFADVLAARSAVGAKRPVRA